ncbi:L-serine ammonia-lyase, iron-sulfur-dependent, subunit alpha [Turicibacter sanguinis]|uniref:L-cysteine desulfidase family protein n=1 Tax=Turicibacter sanguinis TaxID=154288 RepID=UPI00232ECFC5|nr:L-serine ammonia-lyase, iron-sulfur-dependent, subunit alpha [Turicibacter sanguinis]MDB8562042.1 L-serine ammonia-lyase, iron-sulfur-dependent, subunit alpha [Turicibacter sanguinis]
MSLTKQSYHAFLAILKEELVPALGCTEPIAIAYAAAKAREVLGIFPEKIIVRCSGNIIKNAKSVVVPNTVNLTGIEASAITGAIAGDSSKGLEVIECVNESQIQEVGKQLRQNLCIVELIENDANLHIIMEMVAGDQSSLVELIHTHTNVCRIEKNGEVLLSKQFNKDDFNSALADRSVLNVADIYEFANTVDLSDLNEMLAKQVKYNLSIAKEGLSNQYGVNVGKMILECYGDDVKTKMKAYAAAGSDARMCGCSLPVMTTSGSGNQGMTASLPIIIYAREKGLTEEQMYRGLILASLVTIHQKTFIGRLSAYCGAVSAACGSGAALTYLKGGTLEQIEMTITNTLANIAGIVCDGAKASCAAKIASSLDAAIMAHYLALRGVAFDETCGMVQSNIESTIEAYGRLGREGMKQTDIEVLNIMLAK